MAIAAHSEIIAADLLREHTSLGRHKSIFWVDSYGGDLSGATYSDQAFEDALAARDAAGGGVIGVGVGTLKIQNPHTIWRADGNALVGLGANQSIIQVEQTGPALLGNGTVGSPARHLYCSMSGLTVLGNGATNLVELNDLDLFHMIGVRIAVCSGIGVKVYTQGGGGATRNHFINTSVMGCGVAGIYFGDTSSASLVVGGEFMSNAGASIHIDHATAANGIKVIGASFEATSTYADAIGVKIKGPRNQVTACRFEYAGANCYAIYLDGTTPVDCHIGPNSYEMSSGKYIYKTAGMRGTYLDLPSSSAQSNLREQFIDVRTPLANSATGANIYSGAVHTLPSSVNDGFAGAIYLDPQYDAATALTVTRHNYMELDDVAVSGSATVSQACIARFDAAAGTHKAVDGATTKTTPGSVQAWLKFNINGTIHYVPAYTSKTA